MSLTKVSYSMIQGAEVNVLDFGAVGDGVANDTAAIQAASNYLTFGGTLIFPTGTYLITNSVILSSNVTYIAQGNAIIQLNVPDTGFFIPNDATNIIIDGFKFTGLSSRAISSNQISNASYIRIKNCHITGCTGSSSGSEYTSGIFLSNVSNVWIENNVVKDCGAGLLEGFGGIVFYVGANTYLHIINNRVESSVALFGIVCFATSYSEIIGNTVTGMKTGAGNNNGYGILLYDNAGNITNENVISNNVISSTEGSGIYVVSANNVTITGNICKFNSLVQSDVTLPSAGISINGPLVSGYTIVGNLISYSGKNGISISSVSTVSCTGNSINNCSQHGIHLRGLFNDVTVSSNVILSSGSRGIYDDASTKRGISIIGNSIYNSGGIDPSSGIDLYGATGSCVSGNIVGGSALAGIQVALDNYSITNNMLLNNAVVGISGLTVTSLKFGNKFTSGATQGISTLVAGTVTISTTEIRTSDIVLITRSLSGGTSGQLTAGSIVSGTSFQINSSSATDTSSVYWQIVH